MSKTANSELSPAVAELMEQYESSAPQALTPRERVLEACFAVPVVAAAVAIAAGFHATRSLDVVTLVALVAAYIAARRIRFAVGPGYTVPAQLVFVPMLFLLPTPLVPLVLMAATLIGVIPDLIAGRRHPDRLVMLAVDSAYAIPPTLVLLLAGTQTATWSHWPIFVAALAAQLIFDPLFATIREWITLGVSPRLQPQLADLVLLVDLLLAPVGFMAALVGTENSGGWLLVLPLLGLIAFFARERQARIDHALELGRAYRGTTLLLSDVLEADDEYTGSHSWGVVTLALRVADAMGLDAHQRRNVEFGALLHDIGKIAVPKEIINKPGKLNDEEWTVIKMHTVEGERMLQRVGGVLGEVGRIVRSSHERWDGGGYPDGLVGDEIPIESCIVSCCDAFDAMTTDRSYRKALPLDVALAELEANAGTQFSPRVAHAVIDLLRHEAATASAHVGERAGLTVPPAIGGGDAAAPSTA
jgi:putative nucleotidyltransferase with HDIG domain